MRYTNGDPNNKSTTARAGNAELFTVIPFFRPLTTDLNLTLALAIITVFTVQLWGVQALGIPYFFKFVNIPALGNIQKNPMGGMDFVVGLIEIVSELSRLVSLSFRLLGSMFAGGILLAVMSFLVAGLLPVVFYFLEIFFGLIQAYVFAILTVMYASQAVTAHHGDDHEEHGEHAEAHA
jgi:F-type H+-transporting ATPase subunit a